MLPIATLNLLKRGMNGERGREDEKEFTLQEVIIMIHHFGLWECSSYWNIVNYLTNHGKYSCLHCI